MNRQYNVHFCGRGGSWGVATVTAPTEAEAINKVNQSELLAPTETHLTHVRYGTESLNTAKPTDQPIARLQLTGRDDSWSDSYAPGAWPFERTGQHVTCVQWWPGDARGRTADRCHIHYVAQQANRRALLWEVCSALGLPTDGWSWSQHCGCRCGCRPGFTRKKGSGHDLFITLSKAPEKPEETVPEPTPKGEPTNTPA